jgi:hypothetical protein
MSRLTLNQYNKIMPAVNEIVMAVEEAEDAHLGLLLDGGIDDDTLTEIELYIEWVLSDFTDKEQSYIKIMVNDRMGYCGEQA